MPGSGGLKAAHKLGQRDVNADRGSKTATVYPPPKRVYDTYGRVVLSAQAPASGAGIATRNPIPKARPGGIDLIAPLGTIDAGIRVSGNVNLAALQILNAANIQVQGTSTGIPTVQAQSISVALSTSNATAVTLQSATPTQSANAQPSVIIVEVLGYGGGAGDSEERRKDSDDRPRNQTRRYGPTDPVRVFGNGQFTREQTGDLTEDERAKLREVSGNSSL